jgi:hypothetical protein
MVADQKYPSDWADLIIAAMRTQLHAIFLLFLSAVAAGDTVVMRDGSIRQGTIVSHDENELRLKVDGDGITGVIAIPLKHVARVAFGAPPAMASEPAVAPAVAQTQPATLPTVPDSTVMPDRVPSASDAELAAFQSHGFMGELLASAMGSGLDDLNRLPAAERDLWDRAVKADAQGHKADTLEALRALEAAMQELPGGASRLNGIARRQRDESFGVWMARIHWELIAPKYSTGQFDLKDVRDIERPALIGLLKQNTAPALEPLKPYFPPVDQKSGQPTAFRNSQLQGITAANALEVKDQSLRAAAILLAQLRLEPDMPAVDRGLLSMQLGTVNRILSRSRDLEPLARATLARAEQEKRNAEEKARRDAAVAAQRKGK